jgi:hypothetical protein
VSTFGSFTDFHTAECNFVTLQLAKLLGRDESYNFKIEDLLMLMCFLVRAIIHLGGVMDEYGKMVEL